MENNFIQMAASVDHAVAYTIGPIFKHIIDNGFTNIVSYSVNCLWLVDVTLIFDGNPQIIVQRCQIAVPRWPNYITSGTDNGIFKNRAQNIECSFGCVARSSVLLKLTVANFFLLNFCEHKSPLTVTASPCSFSKKNGPIMPLEENPHQTVTRFGCVVTIHEISNSWKKKR